MSDPVMPPLVAVLARVAGRTRMPTTVNDDTPLTDGGYGFDSVELLEVVVACEETFGIVFDESRDLDGGSLATVGSLAALVRAKRAVAEPAS